MRIVNPTALLGENLATKYLQNKGYVIIERNFRQRYGEIDIIAISKNTLVFIEVKTRKSLVYGEPLESITPKKLRDIIKTAQYYALTNDKLPKQLRIDAISVLLNKHNNIDTIEHVENISI